MSERRYLTAEQVAEKMCCSRQHVYNMLESGQLPCVDFSTPGSKKKLRRISEDALDKWLSARTQDRRRR